MTKEPEHYKHLARPLTVVVNDQVTMYIENGLVTMRDRTDNHVVTMSEWELGEALDTYMLTKVRERKL